MDSVYKQKRQANPRETAGLFSVLTFFYTIPTFIKGYRNELNEGDLYETLSEDKSGTLGYNAEKMWNIELNKYRKTKISPKFRIMLAKLFQVDFILIAIGYVSIELVFRPAQIMSLGYLISHFMDESNAPGSIPYIEVTCLLVFTLLIAFVFHLGVMKAFHTGMKIRVAVCSLIYRKALQLNQSAFSETTAGQMINLLSNDVGVYDRFAALSHYCWISPLQLLIFIYLMYLEVGVSSVIGALVLILTLPLHAFFGNLSGKYRSKTARKTDVRIRLMDEIIRGIQIIKIYAWEISFAKIVALSRRSEINSITIASYIKGTWLLYFLYISVPLFVTMISYALFGNTIDARKVFMVTAFYNILGFSMGTLFPQGMASMGESAASSNRILKFLLLDENHYSNSKSEDNENAVVMINATAKWSGTSTENTFTNLNITIKRGSLVAVVGSVGSGKTSILQCLLEELPLIFGTVSVSGSVSYASQEPWIFGGTVQQNILFGSELDEDRYKKVIKNCALATDFNLLPYGDKSIIGERGASLSGGQRARINLARAIYRDADVYLLDDPLSAVDANVGNQIFNDCICGYLRHKTVILVTHQLQYLQHVDHIIVMENGFLTVEGCYTDLQGFFKHDEAEAGTQNNVKTVVGEESVEKLTEDAPKMIEEQRSTGGVSSTIYKDYIIASGSYPLIVFALVLFICVQLTLSSSFYFITHWVNFEQSFNYTLENNFEVEKPSRYVFIYTYSAITLTIIILTLLRNTICYNISMRSSIQLHDSMFKRLVHAPMKFFNTNSSGRILNRFSKDMGSVDELLPTTAIITIQTLFSILGIMIVACVVNPLLIIPSILIGIMFHYLKLFYLSSSLSIKRLEGTTRSPVFGHLNATLQGLTTIRAFGAQEILKKEFDDKQDLNSCCIHLFYSTSRAFGLGLDLICFAYLSCITLVLFAISHETQSGNIGLVITQAMQLMGQLQWGARQSTELENYMTSVERVLEYNSIEQERSFESSINDKPPTTWPEYGKIMFDKVSLHYTQTESAVLKDISFVIEPQAKIGIVGRTGAGKSSLISAIFQLAEIEGSIRIDEIDIKDIGLHDLRKKISIIPQNPVVFAGTVRKNLDPFDEYSDDLLWNALEDVQLKEAIEILDSGLNAQISEGGSNLSVGQRQLICLARVILRKNKILILDEATANVDLQTDSVIQQTIREKFANCTVLTVAHRLHTIMDSDKVLVMDAGEVVEFDHPHILLKNQSWFYHMVQQTENAMATTLTKIAQDRYEELQK